VVAIKEFAVWFYKGKAWRKCRTGYFQSQHGICERCGGAGRIVHHKKYITPANINNPSIALDWSNLELLCDECHQKEHQKTQSTAKSTIFDVNGDLIAPPPMKIHETSQNHVPHIHIPRFSLFNKNKVKK
jgi:5-methylcytosine-specific restriction endonuclease McrA